MIKTRRLALDVRYNSYPFAGQVGGDIESLTYTDSAADNSDSIDITINAQDRKWLLGWMPEKGATLRARILGYNWERQGQRSIMECGLFVLDDVSFSDAPTTLQVGGVSKPSDSDFSELERDVIWKNTSIKRIGAKIAARYGLAFTYDADDYDIECDEQDGTDSSYYNGLCKNYGLILKVYARRLWVYDREKYKAKRAVRTFDRSQIRPGSFGYTTTLSGTYTGGYFNYTDADKDIDIECSVGGGSHTKSVNQRIRCQRPALRGVEQRQPRDGEAALRRGRRLEGKRGKLHRADRLWKPERKILCGQGDTQGFQKRTDHRL